MNELELDDAWQRSVFERLLEPILVEHAYRHQIVFFDVASPIGAVVQKQAHTDMTAQLPQGGNVSGELKIVRWPGAKVGCPSRMSWRDMFLETWSCTVPGHETRGWMTTSQADFLLWSQCSADERALDCWPFPFIPLRHWFNDHFRELPIRSVRNEIDGHAMWTRGRLAPIGRVCRELHVSGFRVEDSGLVADFFGTPLLRFLQEKVS